MVDLTSAEQYRRFTSSPAILSAKHFFDNLLVERHSVFGDFISKISTGKTPQKSISKYYEYSEICWFKPTDIGKDIYLNKANSYISNKATSDKKATFFERETLLITCIGDIGRVGILKNDSSANQQITGVLTNQKLLPEFAYLYLVSHREIFTDSEVLKTTLPIINQKKIRSLLIKVPSINIQKAVIRFYFSYIKTGFPRDLPVELELYRKQLIDFSKLVDSTKYFSKDIKTELTHQQSLLKKLRQQILQEAIEGKLTKDWRADNPNIEPASELLKRIQAEKAQLIKDKKIKKQKPLPPISEEEKPFELPDGWVWCRLGEVTYGFQYGTSSKSLETGKIPVLRMGNIQKGKIDWDNLVYSNNDEEIDKFDLIKGDLLFNRTNSRELVGKTGLYHGEYASIFAGYLVRFHMAGKIVAEFSNIVLNSMLHSEWCNEVKTDAIGQSNINATKLSSFIFPLPPLPEQKAIVAKVEKLLSLCDQLESQISHNQSHAEQLMQAVLKEAFLPRRQADSQDTIQTEAVEANA